MSYQTIVTTQGQRERSQDRAKIFAHRDSVVPVIADGAGGTIRGEEAAQSVIDGAAVLLHQAPLITAEKDWCSLLLRLDQKIARTGGQTTAVIASVSPSGVTGASVGDSIAWMITDNGCVDLTEHSNRKPLLGSGEVTPVGFSYGTLQGTLLFASDGLWRYLALNLLCEIIRKNDLETAAALLLEAIKMPSGALQDDVSLILVR